MTQGSHIIERYYKSRIPKVSHTLGCNHIRVNPHKSLYNNTIARARKESQRRPRNSRDERRESEDSYPQRNAHRGARGRVSTTPVTKAVAHRQTARSSWHEPNSMREARPAQKSQQRLGGADNTRAAAVRCCRAGFPCASPASSSSWAGLRSACIIFVLIRHL